MYNAIKAGTTDTYMLWAPNVDVEATPNYMVCLIVLCGANRIMLTSANRHTILVPTTSIYMVYPCGPS